MNNFCLHPNQVQLVAAAYERRHSSSLEAAIQSEFSGNLKQALVNLLHDPIDVFARYIKVFCDCSAYYSIFIKCFNSIVCVFAKGLLCWTRDL